MDLSGAVIVGRNGDPDLYALKEAGRRMADVLNLHVTAGLAATGRILAFRLADGSSDGQIYDSRADAIAHQLAPCHYEVLRPSGYSADECALTLAYARAQHDAGWRTEPDYPAPITPVRREDAALKFAQLNAKARRARARARFTRR